jgi:glycosyltransferase involved in cell wall biosynthesis
VEKPPVDAEYLIPSLDEFPNRHNFKDIVKIKKIIEDENIDIVFINEIKNYAIIRALNMCRPTIGMMHACHYFCLRGFKTFRISRRICNNNLGFACILHGCFLKRHPERKFFPKFENIIKTRCRLDAYRELKKVIAPSRYIKNELITHGFKNEQVTVLPPYAGERLGFQVKNLTYNNNIVLFAGRIVSYKGVDVLLKALSFVEANFEAWIIGEGSYRNKCEYISKKLNLQNKVKFLGWIDNDNLHNFYSKATLVAVPSVCAESHVMVGVEAMSYGRPVVAFDVGGISDWLENGETGFLVKLMDYRTFADKITLLLTNKSLAEEMGMNGYKKYLVKFNKINYIERLIEIFQSVM